MGVVPDQIFLALAESEGRKAKEEEEKLAPLSLFCTTHRQKCGQLLRTFSCSVLSTSSARMFILRSESKLPLLLCLMYKFPCPFFAASQSPFSRGNVGAPFQIWKRSADRMLQHRFLQAFMQNMKSVFSGIICFSFTCFSLFQNLHTIHKAANLPKQFAQNM